MAQVELLLPKMGESVAEATIIKWLKKEGDKVEAEETVLEIATDKVDSEVPSTASGVITKILYKEGDVVQVGKPIAIISTEADIEHPATTSTNPIVSSTLTTNLSQNNETIKSQSVSEIPKNGEGNKFYSPLVRNIAKAEGISFEELESITGTGLHGRVTKNDILNYIPKRKTIQATTATPSSASTTTTTTTKSSSTPASEQAITSAPAQTINIQAPTITINEGDEIIEMDRMRKLIAEHMVMSKHVSPHVTSFVECDVTNIVLWRERIKKEFEKREGEKITFTPIFIEAICKAIKEMPMINVSVSGHNIIKRKNINIGMATALPNGNLIVPVIKNADQLNLIGLTKQVNDLANRARENKLKPEEIQGGTFTLSNVGTFGNVMGTPIINQPQVAILATGAIRKKPVVIETPHGDTIGIRHMMFLSLSYDHRVVDGSLGGKFVRRVADILEEFDINREI
jgi:2-oxoglutarate dehydrogenase E2 component (dihydrolipoamide succinyltransferase)